MDKHTKVINRRSKQLIRWAGSKRKLLPILLERAPSNFNTYIEPFCGSASLFFELSPQKAILGDINSELINAFRQIKRTSSIYDELISYSREPEEYYRFRSLDPKDLDPRSRAIRFLYLNRYCFNGVYRTNKDGKFNVPRGTKTGDFPPKEVFKSTKQKLSVAKLKIAPYTKTLSLAKEGDFAYIDPPYAKSGRFTGEYGPGSFDSNSMPDFIELLDKLDSKGVRFLLSYRTCSEVTDQLSKKYSVSTLSVKRHISGFKSGWDEAGEILVQNY